MPLLHWLTRDADLKLSSDAPYRLLEYVPALFFGAADTENMLTQGDNVERSIWLGIMYPRLELLHQLLSGSGSL